MVQRHLRSSGAFYRGAVAIEPGPRLLPDHAREIADVTLRLERFPIDRPSTRRTCRQHGGQAQPFDHFELSVYYRGAIALTAAAEPAT